MDTKKIQNWIITGKIEMSSILDISFLNDESVLTIWESTIHNNKRFFVTLKDHETNKIEIMELFKYKNINKFRNLIPKTTFLSASSFMEAYYVLLSKKSFY